MQRVLARFRTRVCCFLGFVLIGLACEDSAPRRSALSLVGCYHLATSDRPLLGMPTVRPPRLIALDTAVVMGDSTQRAILTSDGGQREYALRAWNLDPRTDTVRLNFSTGLHGYVVALHGSGDTLTGQLSEWGDIPPSPWVHGPAAAYRVRCDSFAAPAT